MVSENVKSSVKTKKSDRFVSSTISSSTTSRLSTCSFSVKKIRVFQNADLYHQGIKVVVNERQVSDLDVFLSYLSSRLDLPYGAKKLYTTGGKQIKNLFELEDGKEYVASSTVFTPSTYGENNSRFIPHSNSVKTNVITRHRVSRSQLPKEEKKRSKKRAKSISSNLASNTVIIPRNDDNIKKKTKKGKEKTSINGIDEKEKSKAQKPPNTTQKGDHKMGNPSEITSESADEEQQKNKDTEHDKELVQNINQSKESSRSHSPLLQTPSELEESEEDENSDEDQLRRRESHRLSLMPRTLTTSTISENESDRISTKKANNNQGSRLNEEKQKKLEPTNWGDLSAFTRNIESLLKK